VEDDVISSIISKLLALRVDPVAVLSTIKSASSGGKPSVAPRACIIDAFKFFFFNPFLRCINIFGCYDKLTIR